ncbi:MAG: hypothetical protein FJ125_17930, partial [Deltaproteobacteria bacterium]|nr:hypothetical protein [Deltaproteobacteria bacterium]
MSGKRLTGILLAVGLLVLLGGLLLLALDDGAPPPRPAAEVPAPAAPQPVAASPAQPSPSWVPLAAMATIDEFVPEAPADRDARLQLVEGMFRASGLEIRPDGSTRYEKLGQPQLALTTRIAEIAVYRGEEKVRTLPLNPAPGREVANERRTGSITFQDLAPGLDLQLAYDGRSIKELLTLQPKLVSELLAGGGDTLRIGYRFDEIRRDPGEPPPEWRSSPWGEPLASGKVHPEQHLHLGRPGQTDFELPPAWADGGAGGKLFLDRILDLTD